METRLLVEKSMAAIAPELEQKLVAACCEGNLQACRARVVELQTQYAVTSQPVEELVGYAFACAAEHNQVEIMQLLLYPAPKDQETSTRAPVKPDVHSCLLYGMCRSERYFPSRSRFHCCFALRYVAYAAIVCVEHNSMLALEFLVAQQQEPMPALLVDTDVIRCFRFALELGSDIHAPTPEAYRPMLMLLLLRYPVLLLPHVDGNHDSDPTVDSVLEKRMDALRASLLYEYVTNPQLQTG